MIFVLYPSAQDLMKKIEILVSLLFMLSTRRVVCSFYGGVVKRFS